MKKTRRLSSAIIAFALSAALITQPAIAYAVDGDEAVEDSTAALVSSEEEAAVEPIEGEALVEQEAPEAEAPADATSEAQGAAPSEEAVPPEEMETLAEESEESEAEEGEQEDADEKDEALASDKPSSLSSVLSVSKGTLKLTWGKAETEDATYEVWWRRAGTDTWVKRTTENCSFTITGLNAGRAYEARVYVAGGDYLAVYRYVATTTLSTGMNTSFYLKATAKAVEGASGYDFTTQRYGSSWVFEDAGASTVMEYQLEEGELVGFKARPYLIVDDVKYEGAWSAGDYRFSDTTKLSTVLSYGARKVTATCAKLEAPAGTMNYRIVYRQGESGKWNAQVKETNARTITGLTSGKVCQVGAAPVVKAGGHSYLGAYNYQYRFVVGTNVNKATLGGEERTVTWTQNGGATGYQLIYTTDASFGSYTTIEIEDGETASQVVGGLEEDGTYFFKVRALKESAGKIYYGPWSAAKASSESLEKVMIAKAQTYASATSWLILVDCTNNKTAVFKDNEGVWELHKFMDCSTGAPSTPTVTGSFTVGNRGLHFGEDKGYTCWYWTQFYNDYLFHSVLYNPYSNTSIQDGRLGMNLSHGCVRLDIADAKWIYDTIPRNTKVVSYK